MARRPALSIETLTELGAEKLARLVLDEAERSAPFRKLVSAALAARKGPEAVAKIVDRRLGALEKARGFIDWDKARSFRDDLAATVATISNELGEASPVMRALGTSSHGYLVNVAQAVAEHLPKETLRCWDADLAALQSEQETKDVQAKDRYRFSNASQYRSIRQIIVDVLGDLDGLIALEKKKHPNTQDTIGIVERLLEAGRAGEALDWVRREKTGGLKYLSAADMADGTEPRDALSPRRTHLEATILEALGEGDAVQSLRWTTFEDTLDADTLKEYIAALPDFEDFAVLDRAFAHALVTPSIYNALAFLVEWPRLDLAAKLVMDRHAEWDGGQYYMLLPVADALEHDHPLSATILYRALLDDILSRARSNAYPHAARYQAKLDTLAASTEAEVDRSVGIPSHDVYRASLQKSHGRKSAFWALVGQG